MKKLQFQLSRWCFGKCVINRLKIGVSVSMIMNIVLQNSGSDCEFMVLLSWFIIGWMMQYEVIRKKKVRVDKVEVVFSLVLWLGDVFKGSFSGGLVKISMYCVGVFWYWGMGMNYDYVIVGVGLVGCVLVN